MKLFHKKKWTSQRNAHFLCVDVNMVLFYHNDLLDGVIANLY